MYYLDPGEKHIVKMDVSLVAIAEKY